jgi:hypothetical protein
VKSPHSSTTFPPLFCWLSLQLLPLTLAAARIKLWAHFPATTEPFALDELLITQFLASSLLLPFLFRSWQTTLALSLSSIPLLLLAGFLAAAPSLQCWLAILHLILWLITLAVWRKVANRFDLELLAVALFTTLNVGGIILAYIAAESGNPGIFRLFLIPMMCALTQSPTSIHFSLLPSLTLLAIGLLVLRVTLSTPVSH